MAQFLIEEALLLHLELEEHAEAGEPAAGVDAAAASVARRDRLIRLAAAAGAS